MIITIQVKTGNLTGLMSLKIVLLVLIGLDKYTLKEIGTKNCKNTLQVMKMHI